MRQKKKIRISSWIFAIVYLLYGCFLFIVVPNNGNILYATHASLSKLSNLVYSAPPLIWIILALIMAILLIVRDTSGKTVLFPNWAAVLILLISGFILYIALFSPLFLLR